MAVAIRTAVSVRRPSCPSGEAEVLRDETGTGTAEARRGTGPSTSTQMGERTSGRASAQQGHAATCQDSRPKPQSGGRGRVEVWRMSPEERRGAGNAGRGRANTTLGEVTPQGGQGALGTVMALRVTPHGTWSPVAVVHGAEGSPRSQPSACGVSVRVHLSFHAFGQAAW
jgi:hypothetical protein